MRISRTELIVAREGPRGTHGGDWFNWRRPDGVPGVVECSRAGVAPVHWLSWTALVWRHAICSAPAPAAAGCSLAAQHGVPVSQPIKGTYAYCRLFID